MKRILFSFILICNVAIFSYAQDFQQRADYTISVSLDTANKILSGDVILQYTNNSNSSLDELYFHLWMNAYNSKSSFFSRQNLAGNDSKFYWADENEMGGYKKIEFSNGSKELNWTYYKNNEEYVELKLNEPLLPGQTRSIHISFEEKIPYIYSRGGWAKDFFALTQWFPKVAVYDTDGWHTFPYLEMGEYYSEFGNYDVTIDTPDSTVIGATGVLTGTDTLESGRIIRNYKAEKVLDFAWFYGPNMIEKRGSITLDNGHKVDLHYYAPKGYPLNNIKVADTLVPQVEGQVNNNLSPVEMMARGVRFYSEEVAPYPYPQVSVVIGPLNTGGGMEYPMITLVAPMKDPETLDRTITHEIGHNWFQGILGFNERTSPYLDEGINSFYENKYMKKFYGERKQDFQIMAARTDLNFDQLLYLGSYERGEIVPLNSHTHDMTMMQYYFNGYMIPPSLFKKLEEVTGTDIFKQNMQEFYQIHQFGHPKIQDLRRIFEKEGKDYSWFFEDMISSVKSYDVGIKDVQTRGDNYSVTLKNTGEIKAPAVLNIYDGPEIVKSISVEKFNTETTVTVPIDDYDYFEIDAEIAIDQSPENNQYAFVPERKQKFLNPVLGLNNPGIDKVWWYPILNYNYPSGMIFGAGLHNITVPGNNFEFYINPGFGIKSAEVVGLAGMEYYKPSNNKKLRYFNAGWSAKRYTYLRNEELDYNLNYIRINPHLKWSFQANDSFNPWYKTLTFSAPIVSQELPRFDSETGSFSNKENIYRVIPRAEFTIQKYSPVNNVELNLLAEYQSYEGFNDGENENYLKTTVELITDYAYAPGKKINARFFIGAFPVNSARDIGSVANEYVQGTFAMSSQGYNDYAFDGYFLDRSERSQNILSQQIRQNDGGFKDFLGSSYAQVVGNSNSFLAAANLSLDIPFMPKKIPLKPYFDIGVYDDATPTGEGMKLLFSGGIMFGKSNWPVSIYLPLVYSGEIGNIHKERGNIWKRITFKMDLEDFGLSQKARDTKLEKLGIFQ
ncbi:M1 family metallopeptidase [Membranihabitans maritimus]|uniref:M1 family metallopeptidase n=1 Tax=Membranihabitans maritimus TaxID=2904244 RepID=UPI001F339125|nr:M1 family metallopeptidase [Membranihabitans maritimus]